jgi:hypothetical protein
MSLILWMDVVAVSLASFVLIEIEKWVRRKRANQARLEA